MKSLAYTLSEILNELPFGPAPEYFITINEHFQTSLADALEMAEDVVGRDASITHLHMPPLFLSDVS